MPPEKGWGLRLFPDANRIGRLKAVTSIPILLEHYRQLLEVGFFCVPSHAKSDGHFLNLSEMCR